MMNNGLIPLTAETEDLLDAVHHADILVGIPSFNNAKTIGHVVRAVGAGLAKYFHGYRAVLVNSDGGSTDDTPAIVAHTMVDLEPLFISDRQSTLHRIVTPYHGIPGKGSAFRTIFEIARRLKVKACAVVDSDVRSITPEWMELLLRPIIKEGYDYVAPYYRRHKYDGTITNSIAYPLTRALYGQEVRQPIGGDFGFTGELAQHYLEKHVWESDVARFGIDIWMTTEAITNGAKVCQSFLGAKIHDPKDPAADLSSMLRQVVGALFALMEAHAPSWLSVTESRKVPLFGFQYEVGVEPVNVNVERMVDLFHLGLTDLHDIWVRILSEEVLEQLSHLRAVPARDFRIPDTLWAHIIYDAALAHHRNVLPREHLLKALTPLYLGKTASFVLDSQGLTTAEAEHLIETLCRTFEKEKEYLVTHWPQSHDVRDVVSAAPARPERSQP
ncbi:MAG: glycosyltransferase [Nitrospira sp.]|nr:glycosyltransferase [Nitrospira sp.]MDH4304213.1 glycosyltransferase [Nitrospira sp.]MDH5195044.1 glycosyltransferase [Nitrospira sp.]